MAGTQKHLLYAEVGLETPDAKGKHLQKHNTGNIEDAAQNQVLEMVLALKM